MKALGTPYSWVPPGRQGVAVQRQKSKEGKQRQDELQMSHNGNSSHCPQTILNVWDLHFHKREELHEAHSATFRGV